MDPTSRTVPVFTMSVAAELLDLPAATLRLYERKGLVLPARTDGGTRRYSADDIDRMRRIADHQTDGINLAGIRTVMGLEDENAELRASLGRRDPETAATEPMSGGPHHRSARERAPQQQRALPRGAGTASDRVHNLTSKSS